MKFVIFENKNLNIMKNRKQEVGKSGEDEACLYLIGLGHTVLARNWRYSHLELDIVSLYKEELHIVEVKSRTEPVAADPSLNVNRTKRDRLVKAAGAFLNSREMFPLPKDLEIFFDVVTVVFGKGNSSIEYYPKAFTPIYD